MKKIIAAAMTAASILSVVPTHAKIQNIVHVFTAKGARVTVISGKTKKTRTLGKGEVSFNVPSLKNVRVRIEKKGFLTWEDTYTYNAKQKTGIGVYHGGPHDYYSVGMTPDKSSENAYIYQALVRRGSKGQLSGHVANGYNVSGPKAFNATLTATDGKHTFKTKMKYGKFDFGVIPAGYYRISGEGKYKGQKISYYGRQSIVPAYDSISAWGDKGRINFGYRTF